MLMSPSADLLLRVASAFRGFAAQMETIASEITSSQDNANEQNRERPITNFNWNEYLKKLSKTAEPAQIIFDNPEFDESAILRICHEKKVMTKPGTIGGLFGYIRATFVVMVEKKLPGHAIAASWLAKASKRRRREDGIGAELARRALRDLSLRPSQFRQKCRDEGISAEEAVDKTIEGAYRYTRLAWALAQAQMERTHIRD